MSESNNKEHPLKSILARLEKVTNEVSKSEGYTSETEKLKILVELTREQVKYEDPSSSTR